jgi:hypothetical protein
VMMTLSNYQIDRVIKAYLRNMTLRAASGNDDLHGELPEDQVAISEEALKTMFFGRIQKHLTKKLTRHNP